MGALLNMTPAFIKNIFADIIVIYFEKGITPFKKPLLFAFPAILIIYSAVYSPLSSKTVRLSSDLTKLEVISQNFQDYRNAKEKLLLFQARLPKDKDKDDWLNLIITETAKKNAIVVDRLAAQDETEITGFLIVSRQVSVITSYAKLGAWLADIENTPVLLKVSMLSIKKQEATPGAIEVTFKLSTVFSGSSGASSGGGGI